jgi:hydroxymethylpyrimidine pyrophosphatase-like HAD family hydrolase
MAMLQLAGIGVAMGNAPANVKQVANYVTADVDRYHGRIAPLQNS